MEGGPAKGFKGDRKGYEKREEIKTLGGEKTLGMSISVWNDGLLIVSVKRKSGRAVEKQVLEV